MTRDSFNDDVYRAWAALAHEARMTASQAEAFCWEIADGVGPAGRRARYERAMNVVLPFVGKPLSTDR